MHLKTGTTLQGGKYTIEQVLGQGGFGITYLAVQSGLGRKVTVKEFFMKELCNREQDTVSVSVPSVGSRDLVESFRIKFVKEAQMIAELNNHNVVSIYDVFEENGTAYYVMEYLSGGSLNERISSFGLSEREALGYIRQVASALSYIHEEKKILHLDVKPSNVLFRANGEAVLIDFGISKHYDEAGGGQTSSTPVGISRGYAPLEQYKRGGVSQFTPATDVYSLGATLYKMLTGMTPPEADEVNENGLPEFPETVSASVAMAVEKAMSPRRKDRPESVREFMRMLSVRPAAPVSRAPQTKRPASARPASAHSAPVRTSAPRPAAPRTVSSSPRPSNKVVSIGDGPKSPDVVPIVDPQPPKSSSKPKSRGWIWWMLAGTAVVAAIVGYVIFSGTSGVKDDIDRYEYFIALGDSLAQYDTKLSRAKEAYDSAAAYECLYSSTSHSQHFDAMASEKSDEIQEKIDSIAEVHRAKKAARKRKHDAAANDNKPVAKPEAEEELIQDYMEEEVEEEAIPFQLVERKPSFQGGDANQFSKWVNQRLVYPQIAKENGVQGRVTLQFTVEKNGSVTNVKVLRGVDPFLDAEAVRVVSLSPKWTPGYQRDRAVPVTYTFPVIFKLR